MSTGDIAKYMINAEWDLMSNSVPMCQYVVSISIASQKIVKALMFNGQRILGLCESLNLNVVNFSKVSND
jgi:hypothetical protein